MVGHWAPLPTPTAEAEGRLSAALLDLVREAEDREDPGWTLVHVLYENCGCSRRVADYLLSGTRNLATDVDEHLILVNEPAGESSNAPADDSLAQLAQGRGFHVHRETQSSLHERFGIESAPLFIVLSPAGEIRSLGGYTERKQGLVYQDLRVLEQIRAGMDPLSLPVYGCGVSTSLQSALDPLRIKYR